MSEYSINKHISKVQTTTSSIYTDTEIHHTPKIVTL